MDLPFKCEALRKRLAGKNMIFLFDGNSAYLAEYFGSLLVVLGVALFEVDE